MLRLRVYQVLPNLARLLALVFDAFETAAKQGNDKAAHQAAAQILQHTTKSMVHMCDILGECECRDAIPLLHTWGECKGVASPVCAKVRSHVL